MATFRRAHIAGVLTALACSPADFPAGGGADFAGVYVLEGGDCNGQCFDEYIEGASVAQGQVWVTRNKALQNCNSGPCTLASDKASFVAATFGVDGGVAPLGATAEFNKPMSSGVGADGTTAFVAYGDPNANQMAFRALTSSGADAGSLNALTPGRVIAVVPDGRSAVFAIASPPQTTQEWSSPDNNSFNGNNGGPNDSDGGGVLYRVNFDDGGTTTLPTAFDQAGSVHLAVSDATTIYWLGGGELMSAPIDLSAAPQKLASVPTSAGCMNGNCTIDAAYGLAVSGGVVAWQILQGTTACNGGPCVTTPTHCTIATPSKVIFDAAIGCMGLAIDGSDAYFGIIEARSAKTCCNNQDGGLQENDYLETTAIARVSLAGANQTVPSAKVALDSTRFYGPRRLFVDDANVYGVDPAYVFRIPKSSFK